MASFDELQGSPRKTGGRGLCAWCGEPAAAIVELRMSKRPENYQDRRRGETIASMERRLCEYHAVRYYRLLEDGPQRRGRGR